MPFFAKRDTVMPAHFKESADFFSDTGTLHASENSTKKTKHGKATKKAVIWISVLLFALVGAAAAGVCFFLHMGDIDKVTSMINEGKIVLPTEDVHPTNNGGLGKRAGPYGYYTSVNTSSVTLSTMDATSVASGTGSVLSETVTSTLDTLLTQSPYTTVTRTTSIPYPVSPTDNAVLSTVVITSFVTEQPPVVGTSPMGMATITATVSQALNTITVTASGSTVISTIVTKGSADAFGGSSSFRISSLGWNLTVSSVAGGLTAGTSTGTVTVMASVTPCPFANATNSVFDVSYTTTSGHSNTAPSLGTTVSSGDVVSGTSPESSVLPTPSCTSTASTAPNSESTSTMSPTLSPVVSIFYSTETITKISNVTRTGMPPVPITATSTETVYRTTYTSVVETTVTVTPEESSAVVTPVATTVFVSATVVETIQVTVSVPVTVGSCVDDQAPVTSTQAATVVPIPAVTTSLADTSSITALGYPDAAAITSTIAGLPLVSVGPNATVIITKATDDSKTVLYFNGTSTTLAATTAPTANLTSTTEAISTTSSTPCLLATSTGNVTTTVDTTVTLVDPVASTILLNTTTYGFNSTTTAFGTGMGIGPAYSTVVSTPIVHVNSTGWTTPIMTMPVSGSAASQNKPEPKWWGGGNGGGATTCTMMLVAIVAFVVI